MENKPLISVLLPVYNCELYIKEAVDSILNQTYSNFELIIIDDCSTDATVSILKTYNDSRINLIIKPKNSGYTDSLNFGIEIAKGDYIARMDGDDISLPERFEKQVNFLENNLDVIMCGSDIAIIGTEKPSYKHYSHDEIIVDLCFQNAFCHPSVMIRKKVLLDNKYDKKFEPAEDYELWTRLSKIGKLANLNEILLLYREHNGQISITKNLIQKQHNFACNLKMLNQLCIMDSFDENQIKLAIKPENNNLEDFKIANNFFTFLVQKNNLENVFNPILFKNKVSRIKLHFLKVFLKQDKIKRIFFLAFNISLIDLFKAMEIKESLAKIIRYKN